QVGGEGVVVVTDGRLARLAEAAPVVADHPVAGGEKVGLLFLPRVPFQRVAVDEDDRLAGTVVVVVELDVGAVLGSDGDVRHRSLLGSGRKARGSRAPCGDCPQTYPHGGPVKRRSGERTGPRQPLVLLNDRYSRV